MSSARGVSARLRASRPSSRIAWVTLEANLPPSRTCSTRNPLARSRAATKLDSVVLPPPSMPSNTTNIGRVLDKVVALPRESLRDAEQVVADMFVAVDELGDAEPDRCRFVLAWRCH